MNDTQNQKNKHPVIKSVAVMAIGFAFAMGILVYGNRVLDAIAASRFVPSSQVTSVHDTLKLTTEGSNLLYASAPAIESDQAFNGACASTERTQAILGCYSMRKIYVYDVTNPELAGAKEVTAAHEMLHAAYDRLNIFERPTIDKMLSDEYAKHKDDPALAKLVAYYEKAEPGALNNELHSILGTIEKDLSPALERYYGRYFTNREAIVAMNQKYNDVFDTVDARVKKLEAQIAAIKPSVEQDLGQYTADLKALNDDIATFNIQAQDGTFQTRSAFNAARQALVARVDAMNARRATINQNVTTYNNLVAEQNKLSVRVDELNSSINAAPEASAL